MFYVNVFVTESLPFLNFSEVQSVTCSSELPARAPGTVTCRHHPQFVSFSVYSSSATKQNNQFTDLIKLKFKLKTKTLYIMLFN